MTRLGHPIGSICRRTSLLRPSAHTNLVSRREAHKQRKSLYLLSHIPEHAQIFHGKRTVRVKSWPAALTLLRQAAASEVVVVVAVAVSSLLLKVPLSEKSRSHRIQLN